MCKYYCATLCRKKVSQPRHSIVWISQVIFQMILLGVHRIPSSEESRTFMKEALALISRTFGTGVPVTEREAAELEIAVRSWDVCIKSEQLQPQRLGNS